MPKTIQNKALANTDLTFGGALVRGDAEGRFEVPDDIAEKLCKTPGWKATDTKPVAEGSVDPVARLRAVTGGAAPAPTPAAAPAAAPPVAEPPAATIAPTEPPAAPPPAEPEVEGSGDPDLSKMTKVELLSTAAEYGIELTALQRRMTVDELRAHLDSQLYESDGEPA
jgi:hypothetical protein